jgi:hypothetical protein
MTADYTFFSEPIELFPKQTSQVIMQTSTNTKKLK